MRDDGNAAATIVVAFVLGAVTGAAAALLLAPATGEELRRRLGDRAREGRQTFANAVERGREAYQQARSGGTAPAGAAGTGPGGPAAGGTGAGL